MITHAMERARERYGIVLSFADMRSIADRCRKGEGMMGYRPGGMRQHAIVLTDRILWVIYAPPGEGVRSKLGIVVTVTPPDATIAHRRKEDRRHMMRRKGEPVRARGW